MSQVVILYFHLVASYLDKDPHHICKIHFGEEWKSGNDCLYQIKGVRSLRICTKRTASSLNGNFKIINDGNDDPF